jgi:hypothetical protein
MNEKLFADFLFRIQPWPVVSGAGRHRGNTRENNSAKLYQAIFPYKTSVVYSCGCMSFLVQIYRNGV